MGPGPRLSPKIATVAEHAAEGTDGTGVGGESSFTSKYGGHHAGSSSKTSGNNGVYGPGGNSGSRRLRAGSSPSVGTAAGSDGGHKSQSASRGLRSLSADGGDVVPSRSSTRGSAGAGGSLASSNRAPNVSAFAGQPAGSGAFDGGGGSGGLGGDPSLSNPVDTYSNPSTTGDDYDTPTGGNTPASRCALAAVDVYEIYRRPTARLPKSMICFTMVWSCGH